MCSVAEFFSLERLYQILVWWPHSSNELHCLLTSNTWWVPHLWNGRFHICRDLNCHGPILWSSSEQTCLCVPWQFSQEYQRILFSFDYWIHRSTCGLEVPSKVCVVHDPFWISEGFHLYMWKLLFAPPSWAIEPLSLLVFWILLILCWRWGHRLGQRQSVAVGHCAHWALWLNSWWFCLVYFCCGCSIDCCGSHVCQSC